MTNEPQKECPAGEKLHNEYMLDGHCSHCHKSESRKSWEEKFDGYCLSSSHIIGSNLDNIQIYNHVESDAVMLKDFIKSVDQAAYERGRKDMEHELLNQKANDHDNKVREQAITSEREKLIKEIEQIKPRRNELTVFTDNTVKLKKRDKHLFACGYMQSSLDVISLLKSK